MTQEDLMREADRARLRKNERSKGYRIRDTKLGKCIHCSNKSAFRQIVQDGKVVESVRGTTCWRCINRSRRQAKK